MTMKQITDSTKIQFGHNCLWGGGSCPSYFHAQRKKVIRAEFMKFKLVGNCLEGNDLALLELAENIDDAMPICLPDANDLPENWKLQPVIAYGWGVNRK